MDTSMYLNISIAAFLLIAILTLVITYVVHKNELHTSFKGGFWFGLICMFIAIGLFIAKVNKKCDYDYDY
jgi:membrane protein YdbS with pleckstrin-like domain